MEWECGGGALLIFLLTTISGIDQRIAQGANLLFFIPTCLVSIIMNLKNKKIEIKTAIVVIISGIAGAILGAKISLDIEVKLLRKFFGVFLIFVAIFEIYSFIKSNNKDKKAHNINR